MISIIVPAHNEETVIGDCLRAMLDGAQPGELQIVVVCNGCTDETASIARRFGAAVTVIETEIPSKTAALNLGDESASGFPRFYVDADIQLPLESIRAVADVLRAGRALAAAPRLEVDLSDRRWPIRAFYEIWLRTPYHRNGRIGAGVYAVSELGRQRFQAFPKVIADDGFVYGLFAPAERLMVDSHRFVVTPPRTIRELVKINTRWRLGEYELRQAGLAGSTFEVSSKQWAHSICDVLRRPRLWPCVLVYLLIKLAGGVRAKRQLPTVGQHRWERDNSSRSRSVSVGNPRA